MFAEKSFFKLQFDYLKISYYSFHYFFPHFLTSDFYIKKILDLQDLHKAKHFREDRGSSSTLLTYAFGTTQQRLDITIQVQHLLTYLPTVN